MNNSKPSYTTVVNTSGGRKYFSFLPPHGLTLDENQCYTVSGELEDRLIPSWPYNTDKDRKPNRVKLNALKTAESNNELLIVRSYGNNRNRELPTKLMRTHGLVVIDRTTYKEDTC